MKNILFQNEFIIADEKLNNFIKAHNEKKLFKTPTEIIYQGHVPLAAYLIAQGKVEVRKGKRKVHDFEASNVIIGARELYSNTPYNYSILLQSPAEIYIICRSVLKEALEKGHLPELTEGNYLAMVQNQ